MLILLISLAGRRWGDVIGGWLVGLPLTSGPVAAFLAVEYGPEFAALATKGSLIGSAAQVCFSLTYALLAQLGWGVALLGGTVAYAATSLMLQALPLSHGGYFAIALVMLTLVIRYMPNPTAVRSNLALPWWDLPARMAAVAVLVLGLTAVAGWVGPEVAGMLASFPVFGSTLAVFAHRFKGAATATQVLRGMVLALYGFAGFFFILGPGLVKLGVAPAFVVATATALFIQAGVLGLIRQSKS